MGLISRVSSRTYRNISISKTNKKMLRNALRLAQKAPAKSGAEAMSTLGFPPNREPFTELKKKEPLENYASWDTQRYVNKGVCFYDLIVNMEGDRLERDNSFKKSNCNHDSNHKSV